jgi:CHAT domain-containing protein
MPRVVLHAACTLAAVIMLSGLLPFMPAERYLFSTTSPARAAPQEPLVTEFNRRKKLFDAKRYDEVIKQAAEFLEQIRIRLGEDSNLFEQAQLMIASAYNMADRYAEAVPYLEQRLARLEQRHSADLEWTLFTLGAVYYQLGRYREAEPLLTRALATMEKTFKPDDTRTLMTVGHLAAVYELTGRDAEAKLLYERARVRAEKVLGPNHPHVAKILYWWAKRYPYGAVEVEPLLTRALTILDKAPGENSQTVLVLDFLGMFYQSRGRYAEAESVLKRALAIADKYMPNGTVPSVLGTLVELYQHTGRTSDALVLAQRRLDPGANPPKADNTGAALGQLADLYQDLGRYGEAEPLFRRALAIFAKELAVAAERDDRHHAKYNIASAGSRLAGLYLMQGRFIEAESLLQAALSTYEERENGLALARTVTSLGNVYRALGRYDEAAANYERAIAIAKKRLAPDEPQLARTLNDRAIFRAQTGDLPGALESSRSAVQIATALLGRNLGAGSVFELAPLRQYFNSNLAILRQALGQKLVGPAALEEAFEVAQWASQSAAATALGQMAARLASGSGALAQLVRAQQDAVGEQRGLDKTLLEELSKPAEQRAATREQSLRKRMGELEHRLGELNVLIGTEFPDYAELARSKPLKIAQAQQLLGADEALMFFLLGDKESYVFALTREGFEWRTVALGGDALARKIAAFRRGLDVDALQRGLERLQCTQAEADKRGLSRIECGQALAKECEEAEKRGLARPDCATAQGRRELFDLGLAHELYGTLLGPIEPLIKDKRHLIVVPSGALTALPFHLLVTEKPAVAVPQVNAPRDLSAYHDAGWLLKRHAVSVLPSVASLKALRVFARKEQGAKPLVGFGDPVFNAEEENRVIPAQERTVVATRSYPEFWKGTDIDRSMLRGLPRLPETAAELRAVAKNLGAPESSIHLRQDASETTVKRTALSEYRVVYFATHGLVAGDIKGLAEPSLALSIPAQSSDLDDGLLTASEVAQLKLNADWVVLSACNTIAGDRPGAEALSGLARAFFYAGARALLVSHWAVESNAAMRLTTSTFDILKSDPTLGRAEALRRAMLAYMNDATNPLNAYPALWAPFVVVGEGAGR